MEWSAGIVGQRRAERKITELAACGKAVGNGELLLSGLEKDGISARGSYP